MNNVRSTQKVNDDELARIAKHGEAATRGSWHDEFRDSAVIYVGGLDPRLTEGDVLTIFSQYGEILDVHLPKFTGKPPTPEINQASNDDPSGEKAARLAREAKEKRGKRRGFGFLLYEDQRSTVLAVDNLNGSMVVGKTLRVDHVKDYKHLERDEESGKMRERDELRTNARPQIEGAEGSSSNALASSSKAVKRATSSSGSPSPPPMPEIDLEDPMAGYLAQQRKRRWADGQDDHDEGASRRKPEIVRQAEKEAKRQRKEDRARIRAEREERKKGKEVAGEPPRNSRERGARSRSRSRSRSPRRRDERSRGYYDRRGDDDRHSRPRHYDIHDGDDDRRRPRYQ
ncbi:RNA-binding domain-containing protein [Jaminaea rosea]|uniref:RNA-binding domain-containing protein n=1 Tax=Jaminaea rosea TaxID=1569628 RepID=A0A316UT00_9BASI|nr:RNA-binding domain-containing protein [Jaminaea rosea]PWN27461.1 RNA-binding domain-containing protein [Jaminaea rosea]